MDPVVESTLQTPDGYWTVEVVRYASRQRWYRVKYAGAVRAERASLATVQRILGDDMSTLAPVEPNNGTADAG